MKLQVYGEEHFLLLSILFVCGTVICDCHLVSLSSEIVLNLKTEQSFAVTVEIQKEFWGISGRKQISNTTFF